MAQKRVFISYDWHHERNYRTTLVLIGKHADTGGIMYLTRGTQIHMRGGNVFP